MTILRVQMHLAVTYHSYSMVSPPAVRLWILLSRFQIFNAGWVRGLRAILNPRQKKTETTITLDSFLNSFPFSPLGQKRMQPR